MCVCASARNYMNEISNTALQRKVYFFYSNMCRVIVCGKIKAIIHKEDGSMVKPLDLGIGKFYSSIQYPVRDSQGSFAINDFIINYRQ